MPSNPPPKRKGGRPKPPPKTRSKGEPDLSGKGETKVRRKAYEPDFAGKPSTYGGHKTKVREYYGQLLREQELPKALAYLHRCLATNPAGPGGKLPTFVDPSISDEIRLQAARLVIEHSLGKPKQSVELDVQLGAATAWVTDAHVTAMNRVAAVQTAGELPEGRGGEGEDEEDGA